jgi:hypothetical protein
MLAIEQESTAERATSETWRNYVRVCYLDVFFVFLMKDLEVTCRKKWNFTSLLLLLLHFTFVLSADA